MQRLAVLIATLALVAGCTGSSVATPAASTTPAPATAAPTVAPATATPTVAPTAAQSSAPMALSAKVSFDGTNCVYTGPTLIPSPAVVTIEYAPTPAEEGSHLVAFAIRSTFTQADIDREAADPNSGIGMSVPDWVDVWSYQEQIGSGSAPFTVAIERDPPDKAGLFDKWMVSCLHHFPGKPAAQYTVLQLVDAAAPGQTATPTLTLPPNPSPTAAPTFGTLPESVTGQGGCMKGWGTTITCGMTTSDPRVSGTELGTWNVRNWGGPSPFGGARVEWGTSTLEADWAGKNAWAGKYSGIYTPDRGEIIVAWYKGVGDYAGLGYFEVRYTWSSQTDQPSKVRGMIFSGDPPDLTGLPPVTGPIPSPNVDVVPTPDPSPPTDAIAYGAATETRGTSAFTVVDIGTGVFAGIQTANDPRVTGTFMTSSWLLNFDSSGVGTQWGSSRIENDGGVWQGVCSGIYDTSADLFACWYKGTGGYAGLAFFDLVAINSMLGPVPEAPAAGDWGLIFPGDPPTP